MKTFLVGVQSLDVYCSYGHTKVKAKTEEEAKEIAVKKYHEGFMDTNGMCVGYKELDQKEIEKLKTGEWHSFEIDDITEEQEHEDELKKERLAEELEILEDKATEIRKKLLKL